MRFLGLDLNCAHGFCDPAKDYFAGMIDEPRQAGFRTVDAACRRATVRLPPRSRTATYVPSRPWKGLRAQMTRP